MDGAAGVLMVGQLVGQSSDPVLVASPVLVLVPVLLLVLMLPEGQSSVIDLALMPSLLLSSHVTPRKCVAAVFQAHRH